MFNIETNRYTKSVNATDADGKNIVLTGEVLKIESPTMMEAGESLPIQFVQPVAPAPVKPGDYDVAPCDLIADLQRESMPILKAYMVEITALEEKLEGLTDAMNVLNQCVKRVHDLQFTRDADGKELLRFMDVRGNSHLKHLFQTEQLNPEKNGGFRAVHQVQFSEHSTRLYMLHRDVGKLEDLYNHPGNIAISDREAERQRKRYNSLLSNKRTELADYKAATKKRLQALEKRFKALLD